MRRHDERHRTNRGGWLRAAVLGSDDAVVSTASLMLGVAATSATSEAILVAGVAGLVAGSLSMAVGEFVSVSSQRDAERADMLREKAELLASPELELSELTATYVERGLTPELAAEVATALTAKDALRAHLRDELGLEGSALSRPLQAAGVSAGSFAAFALVPVVALLVAPHAARIPFVVGFSLLSLVCLGAIGGWLGGASMLRASLRVVIGGALAMGVTAALGRALAITMG